MKFETIVLLFLVLSLVACTAQQQTADVLTKTEDQGVAMQGIAVGINNFKFDPASVTIKPGTKVIWKNVDSASHTVKLKDSESQELFKDDVFSMTFSKKGTYEYICGLHPSMKGTVVVE